MIQRLLGDRDPARLLFVDEDEANTKDVADGMRVLSFLSARATLSAWKRFCVCVWAAFPHATVHRVSRTGMGLNDINFVKVWAGERAVEVTLATLAPKLEVGRATSHVTTGSPSRRGQSCRSFSGECAPIL